MCPVRGMAAQVGCVVTATACSPCMSLGVAQEPDRAAIVWWRGTASGPCILHCIKAMKQPQKSVRLCSNISCPFSSSSCACPVIVLWRSSSSRSSTATVGSNTLVRETLTKEGEGALLNRVFAGQLGTQFCAWWVSMRRWTGAWRGCRSCSTRWPAAPRSCPASASARAARAGTSAPASGASRRPSGKSFPSRTRSIGRRRSSSGVARPRPGRMPGRALAAPRTRAGPARAAR